MGSEQAICVSAVAKKYCRTLRHTMTYGAADLLRGFWGMRGNPAALRPGEFWAVDDASFTVRRGECLGLIGPNGSGKSTLLKMLNGIFMPDRGEIRINGRVGALIEVGAGFHPLLTGRENVYVNGAILGMSRREIDEKFDAILDFADIGDFIDAPVKHYSSGMYVRLGFAVAAQLRPDILLIDEVLAVGDTGFRLKCFNHMADLMNEGRSMILVSHNISEISRVCSRAVVLDKSKLIYEGEAAGAFLAYERLMQKQVAAQQNRLAPVRLVAVQQQGLAPGQQQRLAPGQPPACLAGQDMTFEITYESTISAEDCIVLIKLSSSETGHFASFTNRVMGIPMPIHRGVGTIQFKLVSPPLVGGNYSVEVHLYNADHSEFWDQLVPACAFNVVEPLPDVWKEYHKIRMEHEWLT